MTADTIAQIKGALGQCCRIIDQTQNFSNENWTETVKALLGDLGKALGYRICASTKEKRYDAEWLYDLVWFKENSAGYLIEVPLAMECEWKHPMRDIKFDFEKLLLAKSPIKLMICEASATTIPAYLAYFQAAIDHCPFVVKDEVFVIAILQLVGQDPDGIQYFELSKKEDRASGPH